MKRPAAQVTPIENLPVWGDVSCITADGVELVEDLQEIQMMYSRRSPHHDPPASIQRDSLDIWGFDLSQRLNDGDVTVENVVSEFHAALADEDHLAFTQVGQYSLSLERNDADAEWTQVLHTEAHSVM